MKVMIIDDSEIEIFVSSKLLSIANIPSRISSFLEAIEAIEYLKQHQDFPDELPDVILLDIHMPIMDGFQFIKELEFLSDQSENIKKIQVFILSSTADPNELRHSMNFVSVKEVFSKPLDIDKLMIAINSNL